MALQPPAVAQKSFAAPSPRKRLLDISGCLGNRETCFGSCDALVDPRDVDDFTELKRRGDRLRYGGSKEKLILA